MGCGASVPKGHGIEVSPNSGENEQVEDNTKVMFSTDAPEVEPTEEKVLRMDTTEQQEEVVDNEADNTEVVETTQEVVAATTKDIEESEEIKDSHVWNKAKAYSKSLSGKADFKLFFRWFKEMIEEDSNSKEQYIA